MNLLLLFYFINASCIILHEIESAYEKEWELLNLPGGINGFLLMHIPVIALLFAGFYYIQMQSFAGSILGIVTGCGGLAPFLVHKVLVKREGRFNSVLSNLIIYCNLAAGLATIGLSVVALR